MTATPLQTIEPRMLPVGDGPARRDIAVLAEPGKPPGVVWLSGFKSEMTSTKATAIAEWCRTHGYASTRLDYSGHGLSGGRFEDGTISRWLEEAEAVFTRVTTGPQIVVGSSMGGYIALLLLRRLMETQPQHAARLKAMLLIAPAWDMTEELIWKEMPPAARRAVETEGQWLRPSQYGDPYPITRALIEDGRKHLFGRKTWNPGRPIHVMHGLLDPDVPWEHTLDLESFLSGGHVTVSAIPDGEHRLSRPEDIAMMLEILGALARSVVQP